MFVTNWISTTKIQKISEITNFFRHYFLSRTELKKLVDENTGEVWLIEIYDKSEFSTIKTNVIKKMLKELGL